MDERFLVESLYTTAVRFFVVVGTAVPALLSPLADSVPRVYCRRRLQHPAGEKREESAPLCATLAESRQTA